MARLSVGMLWFDGDQARSLESKVDRAVSYYRDKYGASPNVVYMHPEAEQARLPRRLGDVQLRASASVLPNHFWIGLAEAGEFGEEAVEG